MEVIDCGFDTNRPPMANEHKARMKTGRNDFIFISLLFHFYMQNYIFLLY